MASRLPFRLALLATATTLVMLLFGASITTMGAGMAVKGWLMPEGELTEGARWFLPLFPLEEWFRDPDTFVEHTHRMIGIVLGLVMMALIAATHLLDKRPVAKAWVWIAFVAVCVQGTVGGTRVLENSQHLAFLHGALAQAVFAVLCTATLVLAPLYREPPTLAPDLAARLAGRAKAATLFVYGQVLLGAWFRHSVRVATTEPGHDELAFPVGAFVAHAMGALVVLVVVLVLAKGFGDAKDAATAAGDGPTARRFGRFERFLQVTFVVQFLLGTGALATLNMERSALPPIVTSSLHLVVGSILLAAGPMAWILARRLGAGAPDVDDAPATGALSADAGAAGA